MGSKSDNSKKSRRDFPPPIPKRLKREEDLTLGRIGLTSPESPVNRVLRIPEDLLREIFGNLDAGPADLETLLNMRLVCSIWKKEAFFALKANQSLLPWFVVNVDSMDFGNLLSETEKSNLGRLKSLESCISNLTPGCGLPIKLMANQWTPEVANFLQVFSNDIVSVWICGKSVTGFPEDLGGIELPDLEHAQFSASCECYNREEFANALAFWKKLVGTSKKLTTSQIDIEIPWVWSWPWSFHDPVSAYDEAFHLLEWNQVSRLNCSYEFFAEVSASNELSALKKLECGTLMNFSVPNKTHISLEKAANLTDMKFGPQIEWILNHQMENLKGLNLVNTTITCEQSPAALLPNLEKITVAESKSFSHRTGFSSLISGGGVYKNVVELNLTEKWVISDERIGDLALQLCESFPNLTELEWESGDFGYDEFPGNKNLLKMAPVIFTKLEHLTRLTLKVRFPSGRDVVELLAGISPEGIPEEEASWPTALAGNPGSISNLKHLQKFDLRMYRLITVSQSHTRFLITAVFRTMRSLEHLHFTNVRFRGTSCFPEWQQMADCV